MEKDCNIYLIGFMGSGKSYWARVWADRYGRSLFDVDDEIVRKWGMPIDRIFEKHGEDAFRRSETEKLKQTGRRTGLLVACGGGAPCFDDNMDWMLNNGIVVYLQATPEYVLHRIANETEKRPLLKRLSSTEILSFIKKKLEEREPVYKRAHYTMNVEDLSLDTLDQIL